MLGVTVMITLSLKEWNMFQIFSCHLIIFVFVSDKQPHLDWYI